uniref:RRM domain-containing protein n=1 Tax=Callorhinchus milii TaxID=7868 RepID=A0A4W3K2S3_CALMI
CGVRKLAQRLVLPGNRTQFPLAGPLTKVTIPKDKDGRQKSYGFVCFKHTESVPYAISLLNGIRLYGRPLNLQYRSGRSPPNIVYLIIR